MLLCSNCNIHSSGRLKTAVDMSAEDIVKISLFLICNSKLETMFSIVGFFGVCRIFFFSCRVFREQGGEEKNLNYWVIIVNIRFLLFKKKRYFH